MDTYPKISLIFVNYRSACYLTKALESLFSIETEEGLFEIIVVNNDSSENELLLELNQKFSFLLIQNNKNNGFGSGNNSGVKQAQGNILGFINPDVIWTGECLRQIGQLFNEKKGMGILGMTMLDEEGKEEKWSAGKSPSLSRLFQNNIFPRKYSPAKDRKISFFDWVSGGALFIQKNTFSLVGGFDEQFFLYFEDVDLCKRVQAQGLSILRHVNLSLIHLGGQSKRSTHLQKQQFYASQKKYFKKHRPIWENKTLSLLHLLWRNPK